MAINQIFSPSRIWHSFCLKKTNIWRSPERWSQYRKKPPRIFRQWKVLGKGVSDRNIKVFLIFFCILLDSSVFSNLLLHCQIKTPYRPNLPQRYFFLNYFQTTFLARVIYQQKFLKFHAQNVRKKITLPWGGESP